MTQLPTEVLLLIFSNLCFHCCGGDATFIGREKLPEPLRLKSRAVDAKQPSIHALASLCLVSKSFRCLAQPILYHEFGFHQFSHKGDTGRPRHFWARRLLLFTRTILRRRDLAASVKRIYMEHRLWKAHGRVQEIVALLAEASSALRPDRLLSADEVKEGLSRHFANRYRTTHPGILLTEDAVPRSQWPPLCGEVLALLVALLPNLELLSTSKGIIWHIASVNPEILELLGIGQLRVKALETDYNYVYVMRATKILEHLETFSSRFFGYAHHLSMCDDADMPNLRTLSLTACGAGPEMIKRLISLCSGGLQTFVFESMLLAPIYDQGETIVSNRTLPERHEDIAQYLDMHKPTLSTLYLDFRPGRCLGPMPVLQEFPVLKHFFYGSASTATVLRTLLAWNRLSDVLPPSLEYLDLAGGHYFVDDPIDVADLFLQLAERLKRRPDDLPRLKRVRCDLEGKIDEEGYEAIVVAFANAGVGFRFEVLPTTMNDHQFPPGYRAAHCPRLENGEWHPVVVQ